MNVWGGIKFNMVKLAPINATVPAEVKDPDPALTLQLPDS